MRVLITGASGFIGQRLIHDMLSNPQVQIFALSRRCLHIPGVRNLICDILDGSQVEDIFQSYSFDRVVHLAAITSHDEIVNHRQQAFETNLQGTINLLNSFNRHCRGAQFLYASTGKVYGKTNEMPISEDAMVCPLNILGKTKRITEEVIDFYAMPENQYLICRIFNIYGERQKRNFVIPTIIDQLNNEKIHLGNLEDLRDYLYIDDLSSALQACVEDPAKFANVDYINIGSGKPACVGDILQEMETIVERELIVEVIPTRFRTDETPVEFCSHCKLTSLTGWEPKYSLSSGLRKTLYEEGVLD